MVIEKKIDNKYKTRPDITKKYMPLKPNFGQKAADAVTGFCGSWKFIIILFLFMGIWIFLNIMALFWGIWDPYPFILLNFVLSCLAAVEAPIILMSQNRQTDRDRIKAERDFAVNRKAEREIEDIQKDLEEIKKLLKRTV